MTDTPPAAKPPRLQRRPPEYDRPPTATMRAAERVLHVAGIAKRRAMRPFVERWVHDTEDRVQAEDAGIRNDTASHYWPSGWLFLRRGLRGHRITPDDVFVDFGSGKGRVVYQAARGYPFRRVTGVELSESLTEMARANLRSYEGRLKAGAVEFVTVSADAYAIPDDMTYAYFFYPFSGDVFQRVVANIIASVDRAPRTVSVIYASPKLHHHLLLTGRFRHLRTTKGFPRGRQLHWIATYACEPRGGTAA